MKIYKMLICIASMSMSLNSVDSTSPFPGVQLWNTTQTMQGAGIRFINHFRRYHPVNDSHEKRNVRIAFALHNLRKLPCLF